MHTRCLLNLLEIINIKYNNLLFYLGVYLNEKIITRSDLKGHVRKGKYDSESVNGDWGFGQRNEAGENIVKISEANDLGCVNTFFKNRNDHIITYKSEVINHNFSICWEEKYC